MTFRELSSSSLTRCAIGAALCAACWQCGSSSSPTAPSFASATGVYELSITPCMLPGEAQTTAGNFPPLVYESAADAQPWTLTQTGADVSGVMDVSSPPFVASGNLSGRVSRTTIEITQLHYSGGTSHTGVTVLSAVGTGFKVNDGITGTLTGDYSFTPTFGGASGPTSSCHGDQMSFTMTRRQ